mgnify:CR=1 FL=1
MTPNEQSGDQRGEESGLDWRETGAGEIPVSRRFDDPYFSLAGGLAETRHVFLDGNALPARLRRSEMLYIRSVPTPMLRSTRQPCSPRQTLPSPPRSAHRASSK